MTGDLNRVPLEVPLNAISWAGWLCRVAQTEFVVQWLIFLGTGEVLTSHLGSETNSTD